MKNDYKFLKDKDEWMLAEHFPNVDFFFAQIWLSSFANNLENSCQKNYKKVLAVFKPKFYIHFYYGQKDSLNFEKYLVNKIERDINFGHSINKNIIKWSDKLRKFSQDLGNLDFKNLSNKELNNLILKQRDLHIKLYEWGWLSNATDMFHNSFTDFLRSKLKNKLKDNTNLNEIFSILSSPIKKSVTAEEEENILQIAFLIKKGKDFSKIQKLLENHQEKYGYLKNLWIGIKKSYNREYYFKIAKELAKDKISPKDKLLKMNKELEDLKKEKSKLYEELKISKKEQELFSIYSDFMLTKIYRRYAQIFWAYNMSSLLKEISKRLKLSLDEVRYMTSQEISKALLNGDLDRKEIKKRLNFCFYYIEKDNDFISTDKNHEILKQLHFKRDNKEVNELRGQIARLGKVEGIVKVINSQRDLKKMKKGDILVSIATNPDLVPAMKLAGAIVTEQGGITCHAAIVSRELKIPCVIGTKIATKVLKDGDLVEVDANKGIVRKL